MGSEMCIRDSIYISRDHMSHDVLSPRFEHRLRAHVRPRQPQLLCKTCIRYILPGIITGSRYWYYYILHSFSISASVRQGQRLSFSNIENCRRSHPLIKCRVKTTLHIIHSYSSFILYIVVFQHQQASVRDFVFPTLKIAVDHTHS